MSVLYTFPGQGSQQPGMLARLPACAETDQALRSAQDVLGYDPLTLDSQAAQAATDVVQLALLIAGVAMARGLMARGARPDMVAGLSIGAYPAAVIADVLDYEDALRLVALRGRLMQKAYPQGYGMTAVIGLEEAAVRRLVQQVHSAATPVYVANLNAARQIVVSGAEHAMRALADLALHAGATRCARLAVGAPSHCELLVPAVDVLRRALAQVALRKPRVTYLSASLARAMFDPARIAEDLASNMAHEVNWRDTCWLAWERGARLAVEMPSGDVLTRLMQPAFADGIAVCSQNTQVDTIRALVARENASGD